MKTPPTATLVFASVVMLWACALIVGVSVQVLRSDDDEATEPTTRTETPSAAPRAHLALCNYTTQSATLVADDAGRLCERDPAAWRGNGYRWDALSGCCVLHGALNTTATETELACAGCVASANGSDFVESGGCCAHYEACVACCVRAALRASPSASSRFAWCTLECRTSSASVNRAGQYISERVYCTRRLVSVSPSPSRSVRVIEIPPRSSAGPSVRPTAEILQWRR
jgi:hypothetical protein